MTETQDLARQLLANSLLGKLLMESIEAALDAMIHAPNPETLTQAQTAYHTLVDQQETLYEKTKRHAADDGPAGGAVSADGPRVPGPGRVRARFGFRDTGVEPDHER